MVGALLTAEGYEEKKLRRERRRDEGTEDEPDAVRSTLMRVSSTACVRCELRIAHPELAVNMMADAPEGVKPSRRQSSEQDLSKPLTLRSSLAGGTAIELRSRAGLHASFGRSVVSTGHGWASPMEAVRALLGRVRGK